MFLNVLFLSMVMQRPYDVPFDEQETCTVMNTGNKDQYEFVRISEVSTGKIILQSPIKGGDTRGVFSKSGKVKVEHKWAGDKDYHSAVVVSCDKGNIIKI
jgi:hypothetical protein